MNHLTEAITTLLRTFERNSTRDDVAALAQCYAEKFLAAGPDGAMVVNRQDFALALPRREAMFDQMGCRSTKLDSVTVTKLDDRYAMAETTWRMTFAHDEDQLSDVSVGSSFILDTKDDLKILFYLSHQEIAAVLRERGILKA
jgi:hypothetical protein